MAGSTELAALLAQSVGDEKARDIIEASMTSLGLSGELSREQALSVLEDVASCDGIVSITARFAKTRVLLSWEE